MKDPATVYGWLAEVDDSNSQNIVFQSLANQVQEALITNQLLGARPVLHTLQKFTETIQDPFLFFEGRLILALAAHRSVQYRQAISFLEQAFQSMGGYQPHSAIARWMLGCAYFASHQAADAITAWYSSLRDFRLLSIEPGYLPLQWIRLHREQMRAALETELNTRGGPSAGFTGVVDVPGPPQEGPQPGRWPHARQPSPASRQERRPPVRNLALYTGFDQIQAGDPVQLGIDAESYDSLEIEQLLINSQRYSIHASPGSSASPFVRLDQRLLLRVKGDSMNRSGIQDGDYVLIRLQQEAVHNDIVAAEISGDEYEATLKRYLVFENGRRVVLQPESDNPRHKAREFYNRPDAQVKYRILGVVAAVLKRIDKG